jgi:FAD/FMN-containing dehydrogenase
MTMNVQFAYDHIHSAQPRRVVTPATLQDLQNALTGLRDHNQTHPEARQHATLRASIHSLDAQALTSDVLIDLQRPTVGQPHELPELHQHYAQLGAINEAEGTVHAGALATWREVVNKTLPHGWLPPSIVTGPDITVGGSIAAGGISRFSHAWGLEHEHVRSIDVLTVDGTVHHNVPPSDPLFRAVVAGHGWVGVLLGATLKLRRVARPGEIARAQTRVTRRAKPGGASPRDWFLSLLTSLADRGDCARERRTALGETAFLQPIDHEAFFDAQSTVGFFVDNDLFAVEFESRFASVPKPSALPELNIYAGPTATRLAGELAISVPWLRSMAERLYFGSLWFAKPLYENEIDPFLFFFEGNASLRRRFNGSDAPASMDALLGAVVDPALSKGIARLRADAPTLDAPARLFAIQQTHLFETADIAADFLLFVRSQIANERTKDRATIFDLLYLPGSASAPILSTAGAHGGFAVTIAWQQLLSGPSGMRDELRLARAFAAWTVGRGKVSLLKNNYASRGAARAMYGEATVQEFESVRAQFDPHRVLENDFYRTHLAR